MRRQSWFTAVWCTAQPVEDLDKSVSGVTKLLHRCKERASNSRPVTRHASYCGSKQVIYINTPLVLSIPCHLFLPAGFSLVVEPSHQGQVGHRRQVFIMF
ncbi:hypothetical protein E2C01_051801 [Portunus trituberculatus]|uniref:Uncharacterized protein n=1 Tax=Portunus trituberculatus TaxID=210409 RepID=A0A5B7GK18_PORTR|nr:hypothetical protein [Portunus trituberculatus]